MRDGRIVSLGDAQFAERMDAVEAGYETPPDFNALFQESETSEDDPLEYLLDLLEDEEITPDELRRQARSVGYSDAEIDAALSSTMGEK